MTIAVLNQGGIYLSPSFSVRSTHRTIGKRWVAIADCTNAEMTPKLRSLASTPIYFSIRCAIAIGNGGLEIFYS